MLSLLCCIVPVLCAAEPCPSDETCVSCLYQPAFCIDDKLRCPAEPYFPQPGDIMLHLDASIFCPMREKVSAARR